MSWQKVSFSVVYFLIDLSVVFDTPRPHQLKALMLSFAALHLLKVNDYKMDNGYLILKQHSNDTAQQTGPLTGAIK